MYKNYVFDLYGTLVDIKTDEDRDSVWEKMAIFYGYFGAYYEGDEFKKRFYKFIEKVEEAMGGSKHVEINIEDVFYQLFKKKKVRVKNKTVREAARLFRMLSLDYIKLYPNVLTVLNELKEKGKKLYLLSNSQECISKYEIKALGIDKYFEDIYYSSEFGMKKPSEEFFKHLVESSKLNVKKTVMIGNDCFEDIEGANRMKMDTVLIHTNLLNMVDDCAKPTYEIVDGDIMQLLSLTVKGE